MSVRSFTCLCVFLSEIDNDGVIEADTDEPQEMGDFENVEVQTLLFHVATRPKKCSFCHFRQDLLKRQC